MRAVEHRGYNQFFIDLPCEPFDNESTTDLPEWFLNELARIRHNSQLHLALGDSGVVIQQLEHLKELYLEYKQDPLAFHTKYNV